MNDERSPQALLQELAPIAKRDELARLVWDVARRAAVLRSRELVTVAEPLIRERTQEGGLSHADAQTPLGNVLDALEQPALSERERTLLNTLLAHGVALATTTTDAEPTEHADMHVLASELLWLAGHTALNPFWALDAALSERSPLLWAALCDQIRSIDAGTEPSLDRADAFVGAAVLQTALHPEVQTKARKLSEEVHDELLRVALCASNTGSSPEPMQPATVGELMPAPRSTAMIVLLAITGLLVVLRGARLFAQWALAYRQPAEVNVTPQGVCIQGRTELLGKVVREFEQVLPRASLVSAVREVRYPRFGLYTGLFTLALGSYIGVVFLVDGVRSASISFVGQGLLFILLGLGLEFAFTTLFPGVRGRCRVVFVPRRGRVMAVGNMRIDAAERILSELQKVESKQLIGFP